MWLTLPPLFSLECQVGISAVHPHNWWEGAKCLRPPEQRFYLRTGRKVLMVKMEAISNFNVLRHVWSKTEKLCRGPHPSWLRRDESLPNSASWNTPKGERPSCLTLHWHQILWKANRINPITNRLFWLDQSLSPVCVSVGPSLHLRQKCNNSLKSLKRAFFSGLAFCLWEAEKPNMLTVQI